MAPFVEAPEMDEPIDQDFTLFSRIIDIIKQIIALVQKYLGINPLA